MEGRIDTSLEVAFGYVFFVEIENSIFLCVIYTMKLAYIKHPCVSAMLFNVGMCSILRGTLHKLSSIASFGRTHEMSQSLISSFVALQAACEFAHSHVIGQVLQCVNLLSQGFLNVFPFSSHCSIHTQGNF
jgi:hypothetical protein